MITENLSTLKIHKLTQEQYDRELAAGRIDESALYLTPDEEIVFPVDSVNGKTGEVTLSASDVGARPNTWTPSAMDVGAVAATPVNPSGTPEFSGKYGLLLSKNGNTYGQHPGDDNYYLFVDSDSNVQAGLQLNGATTITWDKIYTAKHPPTASEVGAMPASSTNPYIISETTTSNLIMRQQQATDVNNTLVHYYFDYTCRKWSNGVIEIFGTSKGSTSGSLSVVTTSAAHQWGALYETGAFILPSYPETLKTCKYANVTFASIDGSAVWAEGGHWGSLTGPGNVYFCRATAGNGLDDVQGKVCTYTIGTWK